MLRYDFPEIWESLVLRMGEYMAMALLMDIHGDSNSRVLVVDSPSQGGCYVFKGIGDNAEDLYLGVLAERPIGNMWFLFIMNCCHKRM